MGELASPSAAARRAADPASTTSAPRSRSLSAAGVAAVTVGAAAWTAIVGAWAVRRHDQFLSHRFDLGNMVQSVWSTAQGRPLEMTDGATGEQIVRLAAHVDPILLLFAPLWWAHPAPETLIVAQAAALAAGVYPVVRLALEHTGSRLAAGLLGAWYLVFPWTVWIAFDDFHPVTLATPLLLYCIWFLDRDRLAPFAVCAVLAAATGELIGLTVAALGVWYAIAHRRVRAGLAIAIAGAAWTATCVAVVIPAFNHGRPSRYYDRFESVGGSPAGLLQTLLTDPGAVVAQATSSEDLLYAVKLLVPTAFLALGQPLLLLAAVPQLGVNLLSEWVAATLPMFHYVSAIVAVLVAATVMTVGRFPERARVVAAGAALGSALLVLTAYPPRPGAQGFAFADAEPVARRAAMREALRLVPASAPVATTNRLGAHLSARREVHLFPMRDGAEWVVLDTRDVWLPAGGPAADPRLFRLAIERFEREPAWRPVYDEEGVRVYRKVKEQPPDADNGV